MGKEKKKKKPEVRFIDTPPFKLKDKPPKRVFQGINLKKQFGFVPEIIVIEKLPKSNNVLIVRAVMTEEVMKKHDKHLKEEEKRVKAELDKKVGKK